MIMFEDDINKEIPEKLKDKIIAKLKDNFNQKNCPGCKGYQFELIKYRVHIPLQAPNSSRSRTIPSVAVVCEDCGHMSLYALGSLMKEEYE